MQSPVAFTELYERHAATVYRYAARRTDRTVAEDIMSETFLVAFERRTSYDSAFDSALPWLLGIATTLAHKYARVEARAWKGLLAEHRAASVQLDDNDPIGKPQPLRYFGRQRLGAVCPSAHNPRFLNAGDVGGEPSSEDVAYPADDLRVGDVVLVILARGMRALSSVQDD